MKNWAFKIIVLITFLISFVAKSQNIDVQKIGGFSEELKEVSGLVYHSADSLLVINDSGNEPIIYLINSKAKVLKRTVISNAKNRDWEDLAKDDEGYLYIADIGNNGNKRKKLFILKVKLEEVLQMDTVESEIIQFNYPEQTAFPPKETELYFDAEAIWADHNYIYIMTKNRTEPNDGIAYFYRLSKKAGVHQAKKIGEFKTCTKTIRCWITSADYHVATNTIVLLTTKKLYFLQYTNDALKRIAEINIPGIKQRESICYGAHKNELFMADELHKLLRGGNLYKININD